ncbi:DsbE family thiol:disulfide interchange protein [Kiloniella laminariae]|uniref:DsbE family thiol:disulfide interchange protein n=1 Tax=Kiloniella laminariae TaxID=454162 RepID=UPI00036E2533|nr:DsbE family thiol:disulfide interchange protein [Kiloniella laminariae]
MNRKVLFLLPLLVTITIFGYFFWALTSPGRDPKKLPSVLIDKPAPAFDLVELEGLNVPGFARQDLTDNGKVSVVNIFASWCIPCLAEHPYMLTLGARDDINLFAINYRDKPEDALKWLNKHGNPYHRIGRDPNSRAGIDWGVYGVPETFIVDSAGTIRYKHVGPLNTGDLENIILPIIENLQEQQ